ncbi:ABC transporter ATP-binding protein [Oryzihumus sp.]|uniref:ABC transporter ATP-binding protein n=1 Tax=Oryzihumus sp. TaxID=1968903 RepID=UPI002ED9CCA0
MIAAEGITWQVGGARILDDVSLEVGAGELLGVIGPNGAGKSSLVNVLSGVRRPSAGRVVLAGNDVTRARPATRARRGLARTFQTSALFDGLTALENVRLAVQAVDRRPLSPFGRARSGDAGARAREALDHVGMTGRHDTRARDLSHGERRKLELAMALASRPSALLLDEPMAGVSAEDVDGLGALIGAVRDSGVAVVMVEHLMHVVLGLADRVAVVHHGRLLATGSPAAVTADPLVQEAYLGEPL